LLFFIEKNSCGDDCQNKIRVTQEREEFEAIGKRVGLGGAAAGGQKGNRNRNFPLHYMSTR